MRIYSYLLPLTMWFKSHFFAVSTIEPCTNYYFKLGKTARNNDFELGKTAFCLNHQDYK